ncbi:hypothetical protein EDF51_106140 [Curtobacterium sp. PhB25]|uniref:hypothetical protein n=1 Tax=Curtobacterium sp. PhB25 TaxID=2485205 RepID=UPI001067128D|nr:hypothetical protein [Curtobacterium sp. PhB25]TDW69156.1 hypothetical protein EDF51_106140 [Curtobacterium sp. PhB25]
MTDTTPTPNDLLARIAAASAAGKVEELRSLVGQLPAPPKPEPRLVLVDLNNSDVLHTQAMWVAVNQLEMQGEARGLGALMARIDASPDVMAVIEQALYQEPLAQTRADVLARIRAALEGATQ